MSRIAIMQIAPVLFDRAATIERAVQEIRAAAAEGAVLCVFPEAFITGYPCWIWRLRRRPWQ